MTEDLKEDITQSPLSQQLETGPIPPFFLILLAAWGLINILQSIFTEISYDEAYYWMYAKHLAWGYFDQPPMIALFIKIGNLFLQQEIGTRLITVFAQLITLLLLWKILEEKSPSKKKIILFFGIAACVPLFQAFGFIATPDSPLLLFIALFLYSYQRFLKMECMYHTILLAISMAGMMYSKYHGVVFIGLIILSNLHLLLSIRFWMAGLIAVALFIPHLYWQYVNQFPSFTYHLVSRSRPFELKHVLNYWPNQFAGFNPFFLALVFFLLFKFKPRDLFERGIYFSTFGFLAFFFITSFRGNVEPHWTISACLGMFLITYKRSIELPAVTRYVYRFLFPCLALILLLRFALVFPFLPVNLKFHGEKAWCAKLQSIAGDKPVLFRNTYQKAAIYSFNTSQLATSLNSVDYRKNQYDLWNFEESLFGKDVVVVSRQNDTITAPYIFPNGKKVYVYPVEHFFAANKLEIIFTKEVPLSMHTGDTISLQVEITNPYPYPVNFNDSVMPIRWHMLFFRKGNERTYSTIFVSPALTILKPKETLSLSAQFVVPELSVDTYKSGIVLAHGFVQEFLASPMETIEVNKQ
jgi:4-amino-4-deoxy-L-arabinose transferase-like glycosyltransferase